MIIEIKIPSPGESITKVELARWLVNDGAIVEKDQELAEVESDKATLSLLAEKAGKISILIQAGTTVAVGTIVCSIDTNFAVSVTSAQKNNKIVEVEKPVIKEKSEKLNSEDKPALTDNNIKITPLAQKMMNEHGLNTDDIISSLKKITTNEVNLVIKSNLPKNIKLQDGSRNVSREKISQLRRKISERLVAVKNQTAMLTTFNEVDMLAINEMRKKYQKEFTDRYGIKLGYMSFFTKAVTVALKEFPRINSFIDGEEFVYPDYCDIGIAVQTDKGLMVPIIRNAESLSIPEIELKLAELAKKARTFKILPDEMSGGTFTITNGGVFGSMLSTPILNPPQSGILGMHNIIERPVAINGQVVIRPMMYVALSYDHRIVDGKDSVSFLVRVKELLETPVKLLIEEQDTGKALLGL